MRKALLGPSVLTVSAAARSLVPHNVITIYNVYVHTLCIIIIDIHTCIHCTCTVIYILYIHVHIICVLQSINLS